MGSVGHVELGNVGAVLVQNGPPEPAIATKAMAVITIGGNVSDATGVLKVSVVWVGLDGAAAAKGLLELVLLLLAVAIGIHL